MANPEQEQFVRDVAPYVLAVVTLLVWLRQPLWSVKSCAIKAREIWDVATKS